MDNITKVTLWACGVVVSLFGLAAMPADPAAIDETNPPVASVWQPYEYGEQPAEASSPALASTSTPEPPKTAFDVYEAGEPVTTCVEAATLALAAGLPHDQLETAMRVAVRESRCTSDAYNAYDTAGGSYGIYQINGFWCRPSTYWPTGWLQAKGILENCEMLYDPWINTKAMVAIWLNSGWSPWHTAND